jgi:hypothetical protein
MTESIRNSTYNRKNGRYVLGGTTEVSAGFLEWWERHEIEKDPSDIIYFLEAKYVGRHDLLATAWFGDPGLHWVIPQFNDIIDPDTEMVAGKLLLIPATEKLESFKTGIHVGGVPSTRL